MQTNSNTTDQRVDKEQFPASIEAFEIEQGINKEECFPLCIEIANRYNNYEKLSNDNRVLSSRVKYLEDLIKEYSDKMITSLIS